jgi:methionyl-tRNA synthetase
MPDVHEQPQATASWPATEDSWLSALVRETLRRPADELIAEATLTALGITSMQAIALQYQISEHTGLEIPLVALLGEYTITDLAEVLAELQPPDSNTESGADRGRVATDGE